MEFNDMTLHAVSQQIHYMNQALNISKRWELGIWMPDGVNTTGRVSVEHWLTDEDMDEIRLWAVEKVRERRNEAKKVLAQHELKEIEEASLMDIEATYEIDWRHLLQSADDEKPVAGQEIVMQDPESGKELLFVLIEVGRTKAKLKRK